MDHKDVGKRIMLKNTDIVSEFLHNSTGTIIGTKEGPVFIYVVQLDIPKRNRMSELSIMNMERKFFDFYEGEDVI